MLNLLPLGCSEGKPVSSTHYHITLEEKRRGRRRDKSQKEKKDKENGKELVFNIMMQLCSTNSIPLKLNFER